MVRRVVPIFVVGMLLSLVLVACGDEAAPVPTYTGATSITVPDSVKTQFGTAIQSIKNASFEAYKTSDKPEQVKTGFANNFKSAGWTDKTGDFLKPDDAQTIQQTGMFVIGYQKGNKGAVVLGFPGGTIASALGFTGISDSESGFIVISGNDK
jgi:ABC-type uncharacterized transport system auxiliary subunit